MRFYFIRHAQSADNQFVLDNADTGVRSSGLDQSWLNRQADPELTETGRKQAQALGRFLAQRKTAAPDRATNMDPYHDNFDFTHIYASLMVRTMETAGAVGDALHLSPAVWEDLHETGGVWEPDMETEKPVGSSGENRVYFQNRFPHFALPDRLGEEGWWNRPLETGSECKERAQRFCRDLMERHGDTKDRVAVASHGLFYSFVLRALLKIPSGTKITFAINNAAMTRIDFVEDSARVIYQNRTDYFPPDLIT
jgi:2,3-bisphosphoglycerate-dependent phosphoglycerate mutase